MSERDFILLDILSKFFDIAEQEKVIRIEQHKDHINIVYKRILWFEKKLKISLDNLKQSVKSFSAENNIELNEYVKISPKNKKTYHLDSKPYNVKLRYDNEIDLYIAALDFLSQV